MMAGLVPLLALLLAAPAAAAATSATAPPPPVTPSWRPLWDRQGVYDMGPCEATPFFWPKDKRMYLMEGICYGSDFDNVSGYWGHAGLWDKRYDGHSYMRIRDMETGDVVANISSSIGFGVPSAFVDYEHQTLWVSAGAYDRENCGSDQGQKPARPGCNNSVCPWTGPSARCDVWPIIKCVNRTRRCDSEYGVGMQFMWNSTDLKTFTRSVSDVRFDTGALGAKTAHINVRISRVHATAAHPTPPNLPPHRYVMNSDSDTMRWAVNNNADGDLTHGWITLNSTGSKYFASGGVDACPSVAYMQSDGFYYTVSGGGRIRLQRSRDLVHWQSPPASMAHASPFVQPSEGDIITADWVMRSAAENLRKGHANLSFPFRSKWDYDSSDSDFCCADPGASPANGGPQGAFILWGCNGQGASGWTSGPEGFSCMATTSNVTLEQLLQSYFPAKAAAGPPAALENEEGHHFNGGRQSPLKTDDDKGAVGDACTTELDCQLNGECRNGHCLCDAAWSGNGNCSKLALLPAKLKNGYGSVGSPRSSWGGGVFQDPKTNLWIMGISDYALGCGQSSLDPNQQCGLAVSTTPDGPYTKNRTLVDPYCEGMMGLGRDPISGRWISIHGGYGNGEPWDPARTGGKCWDCTGEHGQRPGTTPASYMWSNRTAKPGAPKDFRTKCPLTPGAMDCTDPARCPKDSPGVGFVSDTTDPLGNWSFAPHMFNSGNVEPAFTKNGTVYLGVTRTMALSASTKARCGQNAFVGMSRAESLEAGLAGQWEQLPLSYILAGTNQTFGSESEICVNWEGQTIWVDKRGHFHALMHAWRGQISDYPICDRSTPEGYAFCTAVGGHAFSLDAEHWYISPVAAYTPLVEYEDGTKLHLRARERPFLLIDPETGEATHLINGAGDPCMPNDPCAIPCDMGADPAHPCLPHGCSGNIGCPGADHSFTLIQPLKRDSGRTGPPAALNWHWRQQIHPIPAVANSKDASGIVFTPSDGYWHVMMDCAGGYSGDFGGWGHQRSKDLLHWEEMPLALGLDPSDPCQPLGLDTGSIAILPDGRPFAVYGTFNQSSKFGPRQVFDGNICMAVATNSSMTEWKRVGSIIDNPVCSACSPSCPSCTYENPKDSKGKPCSPLPPREGCTSPIPDMIPQFGFRDPSTPYLAPCSESATAMCWFLTVGSGTQTNRSAAGLLYRSRSETDVTSQWSFVSAVIVENEYGSCGSNQYQYSCPDWFELGSSGPTDNATNSSSGNSSWVWMSLQSGCNRPNVYFTGQLNEASHKFVPSVATPLFHGDYQYFGHSIAKSGGGPDGRRLLWGAVMGLPQSGIPNRRSSIANASAIHIGGTMSLGQELSMAPEASAHRGTLEFRFLRELEALRTGPTMPADAASGRLLEIKAVITVSGANSRDADGGSGLSMFSGCVQLRYDPTHHELVFSGNATGSVAVYRAVPLTLAPGEALRLHVYVDGSVVEAIANDRSPISLIVTPPAGKEFEAVDVIGQVALPGGLQVWALSPTVEFDTPPAFKSDDGDLDDPIATYLKMGQQDDDDGSCTTELDCQLNGECVRGQCVCDAAWSGNKNCSTLALLPAKVDNGYGGVGSKSSSWGAGVDFEPKSQKWIMGISDYNLQCGQMSLDPNQRCGLAVSDTPDGPYIRHRTMVDSYSEGCSVVRDPVTGRWIYVYGGFGHGEPWNPGYGRYCWNCTHAHGMGLHNISQPGTTPRDYMCGENRTVNPGCRRNTGADAPGPHRVVCPTTPGAHDCLTCKTGEGLALVSDSADPLGGWSGQSKVLNAGNSVHFINVHDNNSVYFAPGGRAMPLSASTKARCYGQNAFLNVWRSASLEAAMAGQWSELPLRYVLAGTNESFGNESQLCFNWEDTTVWVDRRGNFHSLAHAWRGQLNDYPICDRSTVKGYAFCSALGGHAFSKDGADWYISPVPAYTPIVDYEDGTKLHLRARERPHVIQDPVTRDITHLINGAADPCLPGYNCTIPCVPPGYTTDPPRPCVPGDNGAGQNIGIPGADHSFTLVQPLKS